MARICTIKLGIMGKIVIGLLGTVLDKRGRGSKRWESWRPTVGLCMQDDLVVDTLELLHDARDDRLAQSVVADINTVSPTTQVNLHKISFDNPWDFANVYSTLLDFVERYQFSRDNEYLIHITTGTHVAQICWFLLCEANYIPGAILQSSPGRGDQQVAGNIHVIDLDLSKYDALSSRFKRRQLEGADFLKSGIPTRSERFNRMIQQVERVSIRSKSPILITGPTGAGKSLLARKIFELKQKRSLIQGEFVAVNCATLRGDGAMSALFGHNKGAYTGAVSARKGLLDKSDGGLLFLDEIGELGLDEQAMLLHAIEEKSFYPVGSDNPVYSDFLLIAGTNRDLAEQVEQGAFREDLLARINLWSFDLPGLRERHEDIEPNLDYELRLAEQNHGHKVSFSKAARSQYLAFATGVDGKWLSNFRDLNASVQRMVTLSEGGRINELVVAEEIERLKNYWARGKHKDKLPNLSDYVEPDELAEIDDFDQFQLAKVIAVCQEHRSLSDAGRALFNRSRLRKKSLNDSHRLRQYLTKFGLSFEDIQRQ